VSRAGLAAVAAVATLLGAGCGGGDDEAVRPDRVPAGSVAVVGESQITKAELDRRVAALRRATGKRSTPERRQLHSQALSVLLHEKAIEQEAAERGVTVDPREVRRRWNGVRRAQFANEKAVRRFLGGQTEQDVLRQLRLQLLTEGIHDQIREQDGDTAVARFQRDLQKRWTERTACRPRYATVGCGERSG